MTKISIATLAFSSLFLLASCGGSSPAPWSRPDDSPWKEKRSAEADAVPAEEVMYQPAAEPEPVYEPVETSPRPMAEPEPVAASSSTPMGAYGTGMPAPEGVAAERVVTAAPEDVVMNMPASSYAVQVYASRTEDSIMKFQESKGLDDMKIVKTDRDGQLMYVLVGLYDDRQSANAAASEIQSRSGIKPWVRSMPGLQKIVMQ